MWAIQHKETGRLPWSNNTKQYLIFSSESAAWDHLLNVLSVDADHYQVVAIRWTKA